jgi:hypothetical protein
LDECTPGWSLGDEKEEEQGAEKPELLEVRIITYADSLKLTPVQWERMLADEDVVVIDVPEELVHIPFDPVYMEGACGSMDSTRDVTGGCYRAS